MALSEGFARGFRTLSDHYNTQRQQDLQEREFDLQKQRQKQGMLMNRRQDRRAEEQLGMQEEEHATMQEKRELQMERLGVLTDQVRQQMGFKERTADDRARRIEEEANLTEASAGIKETEEQSVSRQHNRDEAVAGLKTIRDTNFEEIQDDPVALADQIGTMTTVLDEDTDMGPANEEGFTVMPVDPKDLSKGYFEARFGPDGVTKVTDENGKANRLSKDEVRDVYSYLRNETERMASLGGEGPQRERDIQQMAEGIVPQAPQPINNAPDPARVEGEIEGLQQEQSGLRRARSLALEGTRRGDEPQKGRAPARRGSGPRDLSSGMPRTTEERINELSSEEQVFAREVQNRGEDVTRTLNTLENSTLPQARRVEQHNRQARKQAEQRPEQVDRLAGFVQDYEDVNGERLTGDEARNVMLTGAMSTSPQDLRDEGEDAKADGLEIMSEHVNDYAGRVRVPEDANASAVQGRWQGEMMGQVNELVSRHPELNKQLQGSEGKAVAAGLIEDAQTLGEAAGFGSPNIHMAYQLQQENARADDVGAGLKYLANQDLLGSGRLTASDQEELVRRIADEMESDSDITPETAAGRAFQKVGNQQRTLQPGGF